MAEQSFFQPRDTVTYWHVELAEHNVLYAEGVPSESYLDTGDRSGFANGGGPIALHPGFSNHVREGKACAPLIVTGPVLDAVRRLVEDQVRPVRRSTATRVTIDPADYRQHHP